MKSRQPWVPYAAPFGVYLLFLLLQSRFELSDLVWLYPLKTIVTAGTLLYFWRDYEELPRWLGAGGRVSPDPTPAQRQPGLEGRAVRQAHGPGPEPSRGAPASPCGGGVAGAPPSTSGPVRNPTPLGHVALGVLVGAVAIILWIALDPYYPGLGRLLGELSNLVNRLTGQPAVPLTAPAVFNPLTIEPVAARWAFLGCRIFGAVVVVAFMEELFWRGFLIRWLIDEDFKRVPLGRFTGSSFAITVLLFGLEHDQWLAGLICGALYNGLYYRTKNLFACVVAHATSNALLAAWVLTRHDWKFW